MQYQQTRTQIQRYNMFISIGAAHVFSVYINWRHKTKTRQRVVGKAKKKKKKQRNIEKKRYKKIVNCPHGNCQPASITPPPPPHTHKAETENLKKIFSVVIAIAFAKICLSALSMTWMFVAVVICYSCISFFLFFSFLIWIIVSCQANGQREMRVGLAQYHSIEKLKYVFWSHMYVCMWDCLWQLIDKPGGSIRLR